uniref:Uncharacterized protein n=1 Tax=Physcomitrium patens TaxID=3218 RepID=A0A2K1L118_PHYPA|nr:hypothetical protein PHYPA_002507 [Physcomitrium patens]
MFANCLSMKGRSGHDITFWPNVSQMLHEKIIHLNPIAGASLEESEQAVSLVPVVATRDITACLAFGCRK